MEIAGKLDNHLKMNEMINYILIFALIGIPVYFGIKKQAKEMALAILAITLALTFSNLDKFAKFKGAGFEAELKSAVSDTYTAIKDVKSLAISLSESIVTAYATLDRPFSYIPLQQKLDNVAKIEKSLRQLGANDKEIEESVGQYYTQIKEEHIGRILHYVNNLLPEEKKIYKKDERDDLDLKAWSLEQIEEIMIKNDIKPTSEITEAIEDYKFFAKFKKIRRENRWQG